MLEKKKTDAEALKQALAAPTAESRSIHQEEQEPSKNSEKENSSEQRPSSVEIELVEQN